MQIMGDGSCLLGQHDETFPPLVLLDLDPPRIGVRIFHYKHKSTEQVVRYAGLFLEAWDIVEYPGCRIRAFRTRRM